MSLILEALKKAERQHRIGEVPGIGSTSVVESSGSSWWWGLLLLMLFALAMVGLGLYLGQEGSDTSPAYIQSTAAPPAMPKSETMQPQSATPINKAIESAAEVASVEEPMPLTAAPPPPAESQTVAPEPETPPRTLNELPDGFVANLPSLNIDIHSYDANSARSYVLINLQKYRQGEYLDEGPLLSEILPDGVVLEHLGERFILPIGNH